MANENIQGSALEIPEDLLKNLEKIDDKINNIAADTENLSKGFNSSFRDMTGNASNLREQMEAIQRITASLASKDFSSNAENAASSITKLVTAINKYNKIDFSEKKGTNAVDEEAKKKLNLFQRIIEKLKIKQKEQEDDYKRERRREKEVTDNLEKELKRREKAREREENQRRRLEISQNARANSKAIDAYNRAMSASEATINQRINKIAKLRQAQEMLNKAEGDYSKELKRIKSEMSRLNSIQSEQIKKHEQLRSSQRKLLDTGGQLARQLALIFSVSQVQGYIMNVVRVTGEFEKQNVALASILQNKDKADKLFNQITELAVKSPFQLKELVTYTKQLSAYQVEYDKLYDTTKRLADVSAGLGVDMQRLILAFGQVKAANFLRGTEVRQFTEAGINILGELAKYYSELEGRMISVGEVQEMVTKRMVAFGDVEEVFRRITSAGGIFYNMQEKQAETIAGQMSNLQDNVDIMLNSIGSANQTTIRDMIGMLNDLLKNWREVAWYMEKAVYVLGAWKTLSVITSLGNTRLAHSLFRVNEMSEASTKSLNFLGKSLRKLYAFGRGFAIGGAVLLIGWLVDMYRESTKARRELELLERTLDSLNFGDTAQLEKEISTFDDLIARYKLSNEGTQERRDLISSLNSNYGEYLDFLVDEKTSVEDLENAYDGVIKKMKEKTALDTLEKGYQEINKFYTDNIEKAKEQFSDSLIIKVGRNELEPTEKDIENLFNITQAKVRELDDELLDSATERQELVGKILKDYFGEEARIYSSSTALVDLMVTKKEKELGLQEKINGSYKDTMKSREANLALEKRELAFEKEKKEIYADFKGSKFEVNEKINEASKKFELDKIDIKLEFGEISEESAKRSKDRIINWGTELTKSFNDKVRESLEGLSAEDMSKILISQEDQAGGISAIIKSTTEGWEAQNAIIEQQVQLKNEGLVVDEDLLARSVKMEELYRKRANFLGIELNYVQKISKAELDSINAQMNEDYRLDLVDSLKSTMQLQDEYNKKYGEAVKIQESMIAQKLLGVAIDEKDLALWTERVEQYDKLRKLLGFVEKSKTGGRKPKSELEKLKQEIALIRKAGEEYKKLRKYYSIDESNTRVRNAFKDAFESYGLSIDMDFDTEGVIKGIESIVNKAGIEGEQALKKATSDLKAEVEIDVKKEDIKRVQREVDNIFSSYELSMELDKSGIDKDLISQAFKIDVFSLDDVKAQLNKMKGLFEGQGKEYEDIWEKSIKKVSEMEDKELKERFKKFSEYLEDYLDKIERAKAEGALDINYANILFGEGKLDASQYSQIVRNIVGNVNEEVSKLNMEKFKESPEYIKAMGDLSAYSAKELEKMLSYMKQLVAESASGISPSDLKVYQDAISKITKQLEKVKYPWGKNEVAKIKELNKLQEEFDKETEHQNNLIKEQTERKRELAIAEENLAKLRAKKDNKDITQRYSFGIDRDIAKEEEHIVNLNKEISEFDNKIGSSQVKIGGIAGKMGALQGGAGKTLATVDMIIKSVYQSINATIELFEEFKSLADSFGKNVDSGKWSQASEAFKAIGDMNNKVMGSWESFKKGDFAGASVKAVGAVFSVVKGINALHDNKRENRIKKQIELIDKLTYAYENLEEATRKAYSIDELKKGTEQMNKNLEARNQALQSSIKSEEDKKKTDHERIKEWQREIDANNKIIAENKKQLLSEVGGFGTDDAVKNAAQQFSDAWLNSFLEVNDGMKGLEDNMREWMKNAVSKQLLTQLSKKFITPVIESFDNLFKDNSDEGARLTAEEAKAWQDLYKKKSEEFDAAAKQYIEILRQAGVDLNTDKKDEMSGLSRSIAGLSEQTGEALEALLGSCRYFASDSNAQLKQIVNALTNPEFESPMISELRLQTEQLRLMYSLINSTTKTKAGQNGHVFKVEIV